MSIFQPHASLAPSQSDNAYIFAITPVAGVGLAAVTSADEVLIVDQETLSRTIYLPDVPRGTSGLTIGDPQGQSILCSSTTGIVATFDLRSQTKVSEITFDRAVTALTKCGTSIAIGTEFKSQQAIVSLWDSRQNRQVWKNAENNDEITTVELYPSKPNILLAGGDDGLVSLFDTNVVEEEDSLVQVINHGPIHKAGFLGNNRIFALSSDQNLAIYPVSTPDDEEDPEAILIGDLRPIIPCQYVVDIFQSGQDYVIAAGTNLDASRLDLVKLENAVQGQPTLNVDSRHIIEPAHAEEVVRSIFVDDQAGVVFTAGEDGFIRASKQVNTTNALSASKSSKSSKHKKGQSEQRYKPY